MTDVSVDFFRSNDCKSPGDVGDVGDVADVGNLMVPCNMISQQSQYELPQSRLYVYWRYIYDVIEWSRGHSDYLVDPSSNSL